MSSLIILVCILGCCTTSGILLYFIRVAKKRQDLAFKGDGDAAKRIILPCYRPLFRGLILFYFGFAVCLSLTFTNKHSDSQRGIVQYFCFSLLSVYSIVPVLLLQSSVSFSAFWITFFTIFPWWTLCSLLWGFSFLSGSSQIVLEVYFILISAIPPFLLSICVLTKLVKSRVQMGSSSNRNSTEFLLLFSLVYGVCYITDLFCHDSQTGFVVEVFMVAFSFISNQLFPLALYRTLLADTKFWRGMGKHNQGGINVNDMLRESGVDIHRPTMDLSVVSSSFQEMMTDISDISIDFAYLQLERVIGQGASSKVFSGKFKQKLVAIKLSTPPEVTQEVIDVFVAEAKIAAALSHVNIVRFIGICVRPPQIAMVFEFCEGGNLKTNLQKHPDKWSAIMRIRACIDASKAIVCLHGMNFIHRDLKAENYFVGYKHVVKLGDFGESTRQRNKESTASKRMTILGTVSFMAPELIAANKHYTQAIDIYALAVTFWEIWTGKDPYESISQFQIYDHVGRGKRPDLPTNAPVGFNELLEKAWHQDSASRPSATLVASELEFILSEYKAAGVASGTISSEETVDHSGVSDSSVHLDDCLHAHAKSPDIRTQELLPPVQSPLYAACADAIELTELTNRQQQFNSD